MSESVDNAAGEPVSDSAERAYAAAAESAVAKADAAIIPVAKEAPAPLEFPAKPKRAPAAKSVKPDEVKQVDAVPQDAAASAPASVPEAAGQAPAAPNPAKRANSAAKPPAAKKAVNATAAPKQVVTARKSAVTKKAATARKPAAVVAKPAAPVKLAKAVKPAFKSSIKTNPVLAIKETLMATKKTTDFTKTIKTAAADVQLKAKLALAKGSAVLSEASDFTKGNVDAVVASGKIMAAGMQDIGKGYVAEGKAAYETMTADVKELTAVKSPADFLRIQTAIVRRNVDHAFSLGAKNSEAVLKLAGESFAPLSARVSLAVDKVKKAA